ncbi:MAG: Rpn family recombination-promoting nuclease/putative transposase [Gammaproteobacteria bacterium]|nr:Rpn family recombination-promoting nuclease/putative transposase [Gammaproteobacteria bacterium]MBU1654325.1 Rpn family recombination-promoting nuclease/putative transposase [Gammaproteobacteria bacterium]MBU1961200.1 Rpn family recombination-promoting nuclease/putative transposase [Gammaproteobacteria bacterium]
MRFLDVKADYAFKRVFGAEGSKPLLISFLNAILEYEGEQAITDLTIVDPYQIPLLKGMKDTYVDVKATLGNGKRVIIEMQVLNVPGFEKRILHNAAKQYATQLQKGDDYRLLNPVIAITFTDFNMFEEGSEHLSRFRLIERERFIEYSDDVELLFIELPKFGLGLEQLHSIQDKWIYFVKNAGSLEYIPDSLGSDPCIHAAFDQINEAGLTLEELELQHKRRDFIILQRGSLELAEAKGEARGREEGRVEGEHQAQLAIARNLLDLLDDATIAAKTGLDEEEVRQLRLRLP